MQDANSDNMANNNWNKDGFFSGITEDYSNYRWYKGEDFNPYLYDKERPLAATFWQYERDFHFDYLDASNTTISLSEAYRSWKDGLIHDHLPGKSPNPEGDKTNWEKSFETGKREV